MQQGVGQRCWGYMPEHGRFAVCTREEHAGAITEQYGDTGGYRHELTEDCPCGVDHREQGVPSSPPAEAASEISSPAGEPYVLAALEIEGDVIQQMRQDRADPTTGEVVGKSVWWTTNGESGLRGRSPCDFPLHRIDEIPDAETMVVVCEGAPATDALTERGVPAVGTYGTGAMPSDEVLQRLLRFEVIYLWPDNDDEGRQHMERIAERLIAISEEVQS